MNKSFLYQVDDKTYFVDVTYKRIRNIHFRFDGEKFLISAPRLVSLKQIKSGLDKYAKKLIKRNVKTNAITNEYIYILGKKNDISYPGFLALYDELVSFKDEKEFNAKLRKWFLRFMSERTAFYERVMNAPHYQVKVRQMKSRYGSNSMQTHRLHFQIDLVHFSYEIIDSVVVHELAHEFYRNHQRGFYSCVLEYCPDYYSLKKKLRQKVYA